jgi:DNA polymerase-3 subunit alpha
MAQQTLFGGVEDYVVTPPKVPSSGEWGKLERLNKEKALIGIYLSAHPLDDYRLEIDSFCNASLSQLSADMIQFKDKEVNVAGMVTAIRRGITRTGNPFAIVNIEDFTDSYEIPFFGKDFVEFNNYFVEGLSVFINGRVQQRTWPKDSVEIEYKIKSIGLLSDVLEQKVKQITLTIPVMSLTQELVNEMENCLTHEDNKGNLLINFVIVDAGKMKLKMFSRTCKVKLSTNLIEYFKNNSEIEFKIN